ASTVRENLIVHEGEDKPIEYGPKPEAAKIFKGSLKLREVSAGGDNSCEWELGATSNVNFDMGRYGIEFVASPRHADGIVITGPITANMARALELCHYAVPAPRLVVLCGVDAISGGLYADSEAIDRSFLDKVKVDLYIPGNPSHPLTILNALLPLTK
ncbi:MAG: NADH:ubiquinone oxidoreductase, partial [Bacteroidales bacterium]|nr:NADH:ubiquinone oxidoreductase [Bacteroidales bacterium]